MNVRVYSNSKGQFGMYVTNDREHRFRVQTTITDSVKINNLSVKIQSQLPLTKEEVMTIISGGSVKSNGICSHLDNFIQEGTLVSGWEDSTIKHFTGLKSRIIEHYGDVDVTTLDDKWLYNYIMYRTGLGIMNSTLQKEVKSIRQFFRWLKDNGVTDSSVLTARPKFKKTSRPNIVFLSKDELRKLQDTQMPTRFLEKVKDVFLFGCWTGMRFSDITKFSMSNVDDNTIRFVTKKTNDTLTIPINSLIQMLIDKYDGDIPKYTNQYLNRQIKEVCRIAGIDTEVTEVHYQGNRRVEVTEPKWKCLSIHSARKTFVSNSLMCGIPVTTVMSFTGHRSYKAMQSYIAVADESKRKAMMKLEEVFS